MGYMFFFQNLNLPNPFFLLKLIKSYDPIINSGYFETEEKIYEFWKFCCSKNSKWAAFENPKLTRSWSTKVRKINFLEDNKPSCHSTNFINRPQLKHFSWLIKYEGFWTTTVLTITIFFNLKIRKQSVIIYRSNDNNN